MRENMPTWLGEPSAAPETEQPFTLPAQEVPRELWQPRRAARVTVPTRRKDPRPLGLALPLVTLLALLSAFFGWVTAEPLWLAVGHGESGTATVTRCVGDGMTRRCQADFHSRGFAVTRISLLGVTDAAAEPGRTVTAEMVNARSQRAYAGGAFIFRWLPGLLLVLLCGLAIALATGVSRLPGRRERWAALWISLAAPLLVTIGFLAAAF